MITYLHRWGGGDSGGGGVGGWGGWGLDTS